MSEWKEVWYMWDGESIIHNTTGVIRDDGKVLFLPSSKPLGYFDIDKKYARAYTLGQKRRRLKCVCEGGMLYMPSVAGGYYEPHPCPRCNGTGFIKGEWEYQEC